MNPPELLPHLIRLTHVHQPEHRILAEGFERPEGPNIGANGEHLTIVFLSLNRSALSGRLCRSVVEHIPDFKGEILAIDNGSTDEEFAAVSAMLEELPLRTRIVRLDRNHGVSGGRNRAMDHVQTEWVMSLDNDIYFVSNPLRHWQGEIAQLGCRFFSLALYDPGLNSVFLRGGHLYVSISEEEIILGGGSCCPSSDSRELIGQPFLGSCMMGGASIYHADAFRRMGMYDEKMFVGFEDYEFSLRLFREGYKVGCSSLAALVHDHPKPEKAVDSDYEKVRFSRDYIAESAAHFQRKHGFSVWHRGVDDWLSARQQELGIAGPAPAKVQAPSNVVVTQRPRLLLVIDQNGWAFSNISEQIRTHLSDRYEVEVAATAEIDYFQQAFLLGQKADLVHFFWRPHVGLMFDSSVDAYARVVGISGNDLRAAILSRHITTAVYDHLFLEAEHIEGYRRVFRAVDGYYTSSARLDRIYRSTYPASPPLALIPDGVDLGRFRPREGAREPRDGALRIGWVGNSQWSADVEDFKGVNSILRPAIAELRREGLDLEEVFADRHVAYIPHAKMPQYYANIDVLVCASKIEGTPNPVLEAMACGVPVITTDVGIVPELLGPLQKKFILPQRNIAAMKLAIQSLYHDREMLSALARENLMAIQGWDWAQRVQLFRSFFDTVLASPAKRRSPESDFWSRDAA